MQKLGVIHYNVPGANVEEFLHWASGAGFGYTELQIQDVWTPEICCPEKKAEEVRELADKLGIVIDALASGNDFVYLDEENIQREVDRMRRISGIAKILGCNVLRTEGGQPKDAVPEEKWAEAIAGCCKRCCDFCHENEMRLAIDNHGYVTNKPGVLTDIFEMAPCECVGTNLDTMNYRWWGNSVEECDALYAAVASRTYHTHIKDGFGARENYVGAAAGEGELHLKWAIGCLEKAGYDGVYCAEYEGPEVKDGLGYKKCLEWMKAHV
jgi:sugar phosphate isomerase/epimerase